MAKQVQYRRGTTAQHETFAGANGEISVDITRKVVVVHDGTTIGGIPGATSLQIGAANIAIASTRANVASLQSNTLSLATQISSLVSNAASQQAAINALQFSTGSEAILANIAAVQSEVDDLSETIAGIESSAGVAVARSTETANGLTLANVAIIDLRANITASNVRISTLESELSLTNSTLANIALSPSIVDGMSTALNIPFLNANAITQAQQIDALNANVTAVNASIVDISLSPFVIDAVIAGVNQTLLTELASEIDSLFDANLQDTRITSLESGITAANAEIGILDSSIVATNLTVDLVNANVASVVLDLTSTNANVTAANAEIALLWANAEAQQSFITNLIEDAPEALDTLYEIANALGNDANLSTTLLTEISNVQANVTAANAAIAVLQSNAASQAVALNTLTSNASSQASAIDSLVANAGTQASAIDSLVANAGTQATAISSLQSDVLTQDSTLANLASNVQTNTSDIGSINANVLAANVNISTLQSQVYTDSNVAAYLLANPESGTYSNSDVTAYLLTHSGNVSADYVTANFFVGSASLLTGIPSVGDFVLADNEISVTGQDMQFTVDTRTWSLGTDGNLTLATDSAVVFADGLGTIFANVEITDGVVVDNGDVVIKAGTLVFPDDSVQTTAYAGGVGRALMIDTNRTDTYTEVGSADRPFKTFAAAIAAAEASEDTAYTFILMGCTVTENVDFSGTSFTQITMSTTCRSVITGNVTISEIPTLSQLFVRNIEIGGTFTLAGDGTSEQMNSCNFYDATFSGLVNITATNATAFYEASFFNTVNFTNLSYLYINGAQFNNDWTITADSDGVIPSRGINPGTGGSIAIVFGTIANNVIFVKGGTAAYVFQPHMSRLGRTTESYTIPVGWTVSAYGADFRGTWTNNGTMGMKISGTDNRVKGTAPSYSSIVGGDRVIADLVPANSTGVEGDRAGMIAVGGGYLYVCTADWVSPGSADIWTRTALTTGAW
jgi:predicted  nucleic acid-binding Zn-ribbon protein